MKRILTIIALILSVTGCAHTSNSNRRLVIFYRQAVQQLKSPEYNKPINLQGLTVTNGVLPGCPRLPSVDESSIIVSDPDPAETQAVQVMITPRVSGSFLDLAGPSPEFLREQAADCEDALKNHGYTGVFLLVKLKAEQVSRGNGGQRR